MSSFTGAFNKNWRVSSSMGRCMARLLNTTFSKMEIIRGGTFNTSSW
jgi:hypothetical protein